MADLYGNVKSGKLELKGDKHKSKKHKKHKHKRKHEDEEDPHQSEDVLRHGGWWFADEISEITGAVAIEVAPMQYMKGEDNGLFTLSESKSPGEGPFPEEILTAVKLGDTKIALKSGFDKYLSVDTKGRVVGRSDAIGPREQWEPVFQDGKLAIMGCNACFMAANEDGLIMCDSQKAGDREMIKVRSCSERDKWAYKDNRPEEEKGKTKEVEINYVRKFQSFQDGRQRLKVSAEDKRHIKKAKQEGDLHEVLLDRREKMKADRYCK